MVGYTVYSQTQTSLNFTNINANFSDQPSPALNFFDRINIDHSGYSIPKKMRVRWYFRLPSSKITTSSGNFFIAKGHIEKIRLFYNFDNNYPSNLINNFGVNIYPSTLTYISNPQNDLYKYDITLNSYPDYSDIYLFLGGESNFPENSVFDEAKVTFCIEVKEEFANLYPGGISDRKYYPNNFPNSQNDIPHYKLLYRLNNDLDFDGIDNESDNCPTVANLLQDDADGDNVGDECDNCLNTVNTDQIDTDGDSIGDECDPDDDNDSILDENDNCPKIANLDQLDTDNDGIGDVCDPTPNLTLDKLTIKVGSATYTIFDASNPSLTPQIPIFKQGQNIIFNTKIKNNADELAASSPYELLTSSDPDSYPVPNGATIYALTSENLGSISPNQSREGVYTVYNLQSNLSGLSLTYETTYYLYLHIDPNNVIEETDETNEDNLYLIQFKYESQPSTSGRMILDFGINRSSIEVFFDYPNSINNPFELESIVGSSRKKEWNGVNIKIYQIANANLSGTIYNTLPVLDRQVFNQQETINLALLQSGMYAVYLNDQYHSKFIVN